MIIQATVMVIITGYLHVHSQILYHLLSSTKISGSGWECYYLFQGFAQINQSREEIKF